MMMQLTYQHTQRMTLIQKLGLDSRFLSSCLIRSEALLHASDYQKSLQLLRHFAAEDDFHSALDFLIAVFVPQMLPRIKAFYANRGESLMVQSDLASIDRLDQTLAIALAELQVLYNELRSAAWHEGHTYVASELTAAWLDFHIRPRFVIPTIIETRQEAA